MTAAGPQSPSCRSPWSRKSIGLAASPHSRLSVITHSGIASSFCPASSNLSAAAVVIGCAEMGLSGYCLFPVGRLVGYCASCSTRSTISSVALSSFSSVLISLTLRLLRGPGQVCSGVGVITQDLSVSRLHCSSSVWLASLYSNGRPVPSSDD